MAKQRTDVSKDDFSIMAGIVLLVFSLMFLGMSMPHI